LTQLDFKEVVRVQINAFRQDLSLQGTLRRVVWLESIDVSEEHTSSILRVRLIEAGDELEAGGNALLVYGLYVFKYTVHTDW
jgi:hypothetical protein